MARGSLINVVAMASGAALTLALTVLVSRWLEPAGTGALFELIALFTIATNTLELGADTGLMRWVSRARAIGGLGQVRRLVAIALLPVAAVGTAAAVAIWVAAPELARIFLHGRPLARRWRTSGSLHPWCRWRAIGLPGRRDAGIGRKWPFLAIEGLGKPVARSSWCCARCWPASACGGGRSLGLPCRGRSGGDFYHLAVILRSEVPARPARPRRSRQRGALLRPWGRAALSWPFPGARRGRGRHCSPPVPANERSQRLGTEFWRFTAPRAFQGIFQVTIIWLNILLVGALIRSTRRVSSPRRASWRWSVRSRWRARLAISPQVSASLARHEPRRAAKLYQDATRWLMRPPGRYTLFSPSSRPWCLESSDLAIYPVQRRSPCSPSPCLPIWEPAT